MLASVLLLVSGSHFVLLPPNDPACAGAEKGWLRGVVRAVDDGAPGYAWRAAPAAPNTTVVRLSSEPEAGGALRGNGEHLSQVTVSPSGHFSLKKPSTLHRLLLISVEAQLRYDIDMAYLTLASELFPSGLCVEVFLRRKEPKGAEN